MWKAEGTVLRTEQDDINLAADRDPTELGWGNSQRTCLGPGERLGIKTDVYTRMQKNMLRERKHSSNPVPANRTAGTKQVGWTPLPHSATSKEVIEKALLEKRPTQRCFLVPLIALLRERKVGTPDRPLLEENKGCLCSWEFGFYFFNYQVLYTFQKVPFKNSIFFLLFSRC